MKEQTQALEHASVKHDACNPNPENLPTKGKAKATSKPANEVITDSTVVTGPSACEPYREAIDLGINRGRNARAIWQDLVCEYGFASSYQSVQRFVRKRRGTQTPEARVVIVTAAGQEAQVDYGTGPMVSSQSRPFAANDEPEVAIRPPSVHFRTALSRTGHFSHRDGGGKTRFPLAIQWLTFLEQSVQKLPIPPLA